MGTLKPFEKCLSLQCRGQVGPYQRWLRGELTWEQCQAINKHAGIYQRATRYGGTHHRKLKFYKPTNPQTRKQQNWRKLFKAGVHLYQSLDSTQKALYTELARTKQLNGFCYFMSEWMANFKS